MVIFTASLCARTMPVLFSEGRFGIAFAQMDVDGACVGLLHLLAVRPYLEIVSQQRKCKTAAAVRVQLIKHSCDTTRVPLNRLLSS